MAPQPFGHQGLVFQRGGEAGMDRRQSSGEHPSLEVWFQTGTDQYQSVTWGLGTPALEYLFKKSLIRKILVM